MSEYDIPPEATVHRCAYCDQPFSDSDLLALHRGLNHPEAIDEAEREAYEQATAEEDDELRRYRIIALGLLVLLYFGLLMIYALV
jgi:hypothetical protein